MDDIIIDPLYCLKYGFRSLANGDRWPVSNPPRRCPLCSTETRNAWIQGFPRNEEQKFDSESPFFDDAQDHRLLLPARVLGFGLGIKAWAQFSVEDIRPIPNSEFPLDRVISDELVFPEHRNFNFDALESVIKNHAKLADKTSSKLLRDPIAGKGDGLVFLFHGTTSNLRVSIVC